jgi:hypothetical protein
MKYAVADVKVVKRVSNFTVSAEKDKRYTGEELNSSRPSQAADNMITDAMINRLQILLMPFIRMEKCLMLFHAKLKRKWEY